MTTKTVTRYKCDHCRKTAYVRSAMERHERDCTMNPNRGCWLCEKPALPDVLIVIRRNAGFDEMQTAAGHCPACILAAIRQDSDIPENDICREWDYRKAKGEWMNRKVRQFPEARQ